MTSPLVAAIGQLAAVDSLSEIAREISERAAQLRWHEALRRRSREARLAAAVASATHLADAVGLPPCGDLAQRVAAGQADGRDPRWLTWRMMRRALDYCGPLGGPPDRTPAGQVLCALRRDGALPRLDPVAAGHVRTIAVLMTCGAPAFVVTALIWAHAEAAHASVTHAVDTGELATEVESSRAARIVPPSALAASVVRIHAVRSGLEPAGVAVLDDVGEPEALAGYLAGEFDAAVQWCQASGQMWLAGITAASAVCDDVLAGRRAGATTTR